MGQRMAVLVSPGVFQAVHKSIIVVIDCQRMQVQVTKNLSACTNAERKMHIPCKLLHLATGTTH